MLQATDEMGQKERRKATVFPETPDREQIIGETQGLEIIICV